jgi:hypothetical protein
MATADKQNDGWVLLSQALQKRVGGREWVLERGAVRMVEPPGAEEQAKRELRAELEAGCYEARYQLDDTPKGSSIGISTVQHVGIPADDWRGGRFNWMFSLLTHEGEGRTLCRIEIRRREPVETPIDISKPPAAVDTPPAAETVVVEAPVKPKKGPRSSKDAIEAEGKRLMASGVDYPELERFFEAVRPSVKHLPHTARNTVLGHLRPIYNKQKGMPK